MRNDQQILRDQLSRQGEQQAQLSDTLKRLNAFFDKAAKR